MKVLILINTLGAGGAERSMVEFAKFLHSREKVNVKFICLQHREIGLEEEVAKSEIPTIFFSGKGGILAKTKFIAKIIEKENPDIVHSVLTEANLILRLSRLFSKKGKIIQSLVNTPYSLERKKDSQLPWQKFQLAKQLDKWSARFTGNIFYHAITNEVYQHYKPLFNIKNNYKIIYRGRYENNYKDKVEKNKKFTLINVGRQEFAKGQLDIVRALAHLKQKRNISDIHLEILGRSGHYSEKINQLIRQNELEDQVSIHGFVNDVKKRLVKAHAFVFPSYYEGLGGALIEAFAAKLPCICSNIPVLQEVMGSEKGALFCAPGDYEALAKNIYRLYQDKTLRNELAQYSYARFREAFRMEKINAEMLDMYKELLNNN